jgi:hypothetical protein
MKVQKREEKMATAAMNNKENRANDKEKFKYLKEKNNQRSKLIGEIKEAIHEDIELKKEISLLKKKDQQENLERGKNFHLLYKQKLVERILEKKERAERVKE